MSRTMTLSFPNRSRGYDAVRNSIRFWRYDSALEIAFFVKTAALCRFVPDMRDAEAGFLEAFDEARNRIHDAAGQVYACSRKGTRSCSLAAEDF